MQMKLLTSRLKYFQPQLGIARQVNMHRSSHSSSQVSRTRMDVSVLGVKHELLPRLCLDGVPHSPDTPGKSIKHCPHIPSFLHGDNPQLVLLVDPVEEGLVHIVEDTPALRPVPLHPSNLQIRVTRHEQKMIIHQLLPHFLVHPSEREVGTCKVILQVSEGLFHQVLHPKPLLPGNSRRQTKPINRSTNSDTSVVNWCLGVDVPLDLIHIHVTRVHRLGGDAMVLLDEGIKHLSKVLVRVPITGINTTMLVVKLYCTGNSFTERKTRGCSFHFAELLPNRLGDILGHERAFGLDIREVRHVRRKG